MALLLAESLLEKGGFSPDDQMERYCRWLKDGYMSPTGTCFDIGETTRDALMRFLSNGNSFAGSVAPTAAGNGSLMRLAPVPMFFALAPQLAIFNSIFSSRTTHSAPEAVSACGYLAGLIVGALRGETKERLLSPLYCPIRSLWWEQPLSEGVEAIAMGCYKGKDRDQVDSSGYVLHTLEAALWAFHATDNFRDALLLAVNLGGDADTVGAVCGQLAGAFYGYEGIPEEWRVGLYHEKEMVTVAERLQQGPTWEIPLKEALIQNWPADVTSSVYRRLEGGCGVSPKGTPIAREDAPKKVLLSKAGPYEPYEPIEVEVDAAIAPLFAALWDLGFDVRVAWSNDVYIDGIPYSWIEFGPHREEEYPFNIYPGTVQMALLNILLEDERDEIYWRIVGEADLGEWHWYYGIEDQGLWTDEEPGPISIDQSISLRFPAFDLPEVTGRVQRERDGFIALLRGHIEKFPEWLREMEARGDSAGKVKLARKEQQARILVTKTATLSPIADGGDA